MPLCAVVFPMGTIVKLEFTMTFFRRYLSVPSYKKITLIDLRYINSNLLTEYIEFNNQDILFLYNSTIINNSEMLK